MIILHDYPPFFNSGSNVSGIIKVDFSIADKPCTILVSSNTCKTKVYLATG
mgnify:CR=1 FL=1